MSQHDMIIADASGSAFLADLNLSVKALASNNSGASQPAVMYAHMWWADTTNDILKKRNAANTAWISYLTLSTGAPLVTTGTWSGNAVTATSATTAVDVTGSAVVSGAISSSSPTAGIGYASGAGGAVTQTTSKSTGVTLNKMSGTITTHNASLAAGAQVSFNLSNTSLISANDILLLNYSAPSGSNYSIFHTTSAADTAVITIRNNSAGALAEVITIRFAVFIGIAA